MMSAIMTITNSLFGQATPIEDDRMQMLSDAASSALQVLERKATEAEDEYDSPESEIECTNPFHVLMSSGTETSEASGTDDYNTAYEADAETDATVDVEEPTVALQSSLLPSPEQTPKRKRKRKNRASRKHGNDAKRKKGGARLMLNKTEAIPSGPNTRTCLLDSVTALLPAETKEQVHATMVTAMPAEGDTSVVDLANALAAHGLSLVPVSGEYIKKGGAPFHLLQERQCKLVINLRLTDLDGDPMSHFVAFDGECIHDRPYISKVNNTYDRTNPEKSKLAFAKLFKKTEFQSWQITSVYRLCQ